MASLCYPCVAIDLRVVFLPVFSLLPLLLLLAAPLPAEGAVPRPNVIIFLADDLGWADASYRGSQIDTPGIDRLAKEGTDLRRFYTTPICSPTRAALMTGRDPVRLGVVYGVIMPWHNHGIHTDEHFMPQSFRAAGYQTAIVGKWHLGHSQQVFHPNNRGFDDFYGHLHTEVGYFPPFANQGGIDFQRNGITIKDDGYETFLLAAEAQRWIRERDKKKPFFLYMPFIAPHSPLEAPDDLVEKYRDMKVKRHSSRSSADRINRLGLLSFASTQRSMYAAVVDAMDQAISRVLGTLDEEGIADDTIVLFLSDNGGEVVWSTSGGENFPLRGGKGNTYEGGIRVMAVLRWPGHVPAGAQWDSMMTVMDVMPTLAAAAQVPLRNKRKLDGRNLWPAIQTSEAVAHEGRFIVGSETPIHGSIELAAIEERWKLVQHVREGLNHITVVNELFDMHADPNEATDLAAEHPAVVQRLEREIYQWRSRYPISGTRTELMPPPGWRAPRDWSHSIRQLDELQAQPALGLAPPRALNSLDIAHGARGRLIYDCDLQSGHLCRPDPD